MPRGSNTPLLCSGVFDSRGHCYLLLPNTEGAKSAANQYMERLNQWLLSHFKTSLYVAWGYAACSFDVLKNEPQGSYAQLFRSVGESISAKKSRRYSAAAILALNAGAQEDYTRECQVCKSLSVAAGEEVCPLCRAIEQFSRNILKDEFFTVSTRKEEGALPLPGDCWLVPDSAESLKKKMQEDGCFVRSYSKNRMFTGKHIATRLWVGDYSSGRTFEEYAKEAQGVDRIGVLRADVDNLGHAFVAGFENPKNQNRYVTLSRTATLSRQLSMFFKLHINQILRNGAYSMTGKGGGQRNATICYSGGDDLFLVGAWDEIIQLAVDIRRAFARYTQGTLTLSAGIGVYGAGYPIGAIAGEVAAMEEQSKNLPGKDAVTLFEDGASHKVMAEGKDRAISDGTYRWQEFEEKVIDEKFHIIYHFFESSEDRGNSFLYRLLELIRNRGERINFARYVYLLSRLEPGKEADPAQKEEYRLFSEKMVRWIGQEEDCRQLKTAINLYAYLTREKEGAGNAE